MTVVDRLDELQASSVARRKCSSTRQRTGARRMDVHVDTYRVSPAHGRRAVATAQAHVMEVSRGSGVCAALCIRRTLCRHVTICTPMVIFCCLTVFWLFLMIRTLYHSSKTLETIGVPIVTGLPGLYQQCTNGVQIVKNSQKTVKTAKITIGVPIVTCLPRLYQQCTNRQKQWKTVKRQSKQQKWGVKVKGLKDWG